jgi:hypothetical protein
VKFWSDICEVFGCTPLEAMAQPYPMLMEIIETRAFVSTYEAIEAARADNDVRPPDGPVTDTIMQFRAADLAARKARTNGTE